MMNKGRKAQAFSGNSRKWSNLKHSLIIRSKAKIKGLSFGKLLVGENGTKLLPSAAGSLKQKRKKFFICFSTKIVSFCILVPPQVEMLDNIEDH